MQAHHVDELRIALGRPYGGGVAASFGLAFGAIDLYPDDPPHVHIIEGEGGLTPGRVQEGGGDAARWEAPHTTPPTAREHRPRIWGGNPAGARRPP